MQSHSLPLCAATGFPQFGKRDDHLHECNGPTCATCGEALGNVRQHEEHKPKCGGPRCQYCHVCFKSFAERDGHEMGECSKRPEVVACMRCVKGKEPCTSCKNSSTRHCVSCNDTGRQTCYACDGTGKVYAKTKVNDRFWALPPAYFPQLKKYME